MRDFLDPAGRRWDVTVGKESWGTLVLLFAAREGGEVRRSVLREETARDAGLALAAMTDEELQVLLASSSGY